MKVFASLTVLLMRKLFNLQKLCIWVILIWNVICDPYACTDLGDISLKNKRSVIIYSLHLYDCLLWTIEDTMKVMMIYVGMSLTFIVWTKYRLLCFTQMTEISVNDNIFILGWKSLMSKLLAFVQSYTLEWAMTLTALSTVKCFLLRVRLQYLTFVWDLSGAF